MSDIPTVKAITAALAENGPARIIFGSGTGDTIGAAFLPVDTMAGRVLVQILTPPRWASDELLMAFSDRATANIAGRCPRCLAVASIHPDATGHQSFAHESGCSASDDVLLSMVERERPMTDDENCT